MRSESTLLFGICLYVQADPEECWKQRNAEVRPGSQRRANQQHPAHRHLRDVRGQDWDKCDYKRWVDGRHGAKRCARTCKEHGANTAVPT